MLRDETIDKVLTVRGLKNLDAQIAEWQKKLAESQLETRDRNARGCGSVNGSALQDDVTRQHEMYRGQIERLKLIRRQALKIPAPTNRDKLVIDTVATFLYWTLGEKRRGVENRVQRHIVGLYEHECDAVPKHMLYADEVAQQFLGEGVGYSSEVFFEGKVRTVHLTAIRLITDKGVIRNPEPESLAA